MYGFILAAIRLRMASSRFPWFTKTFATNSGSKMISARGGLLNQLKFSRSSATMSQAVSRSATSTPNRHGSGFTADAKHLRSPRLFA